MYVNEEFVKKDKLLRRLKPYKYNLLRQCNTRQKDLSIDEMYM